MNDRNRIFRYLLASYFDNDVDKMVEDIGFLRGDIIAWRDGERTPQHDKIKLILHTVFTPEFTVIKEFYPVDNTESVFSQLKEMYRGHEERVGIYAFYDSMANLLYIGKATQSLLNETYQSIGRDYEIKFPSGINNSTVKRYDVVKYISAYDIKTFDGWDYPKHVESLILRISKPAMNKQLGILARAYPNIDDLGE